MTRALLTTGIFPPDIGGPATYIPNFASYLKKNGIEVQVITLSSEEKSSKTDYPYSVVRIERNRKDGLLERVVQGVTHFIPDTCVVGEC